MGWNWQAEDWPNFVFDPEELSEFENRFIRNAGAMHGSLKHLSEGDRQNLAVDLMSDDALKTSEIEGEILNRDSLQSSIRKHFGLATDHRGVTPAEAGISEMMVDLYQNYHSPLTHDLLFGWHAMITNGRRDLKDMGRYRTHSEPMRIISGSVHAPKIHFEAPPSKMVPQEMDRFVSWFNLSQESAKWRAMTRAGIAHIYFESIHPFEDGNGRIGRALSEKALSQNLGQPTLIAIAPVIEKGKKDYYKALQRASATLNVTQWLMYFCQMVLQAQDQTQCNIDFLISKAKFFQAFAKSLNPRQEKALRRMFREGLAGFKGGLSAENYISITRTSRATATRDLKNLVEKGALTRSGKGKYTRYFLNLECS